MQNQAASNKRKEKDVMKLMMSGKYDVRLLNEESTSEFEVMFKGPQDSPYQGVSYLLTKIFILYSRAPGKF
jgi:ubiquitin-protein ligase